MCDFVPGQVIGIGPHDSILQLGDGLPGQVEVFPLATFEGDSESLSALSKLSVALLKTEPGLEIHGLSRMAGRLARNLNETDFVVDLNHYIPLSASVGAAPNDFQLTGSANREVQSVRRLLRDAIAMTADLSIAVLDSGLSDSMHLYRPVRYYDYSDTSIAPKIGNPVDPIGHGTKVVHILDEILPPQVGIVVGRIPNNPSELTTLSMARILSDIVLRESPDVVNLSVALRDGSFKCPHCGKVVPAPNILSTILPFVIRLCGKNLKRTTAVVAAGNSGQAQNSRWITDYIENLVFAVASNKNGEMTRYSGTIKGPLSDLISASAFGGDDADDIGSEAMFSDGARGTSFSAPIVSAATLIGKSMHGPYTANYPTRLGQVVQTLLDGAREGRSLRLMQSRDGEI